MLKTGRWAPVSSTCPATCRNYLRIYSLRQKLKWGSGRLTSNSYGDTPTRFHIMYMYILLCKYLPSEYHSFSFVAVFEMYRSLRLCRIDSDSESEVLQNTVRLSLTSVPNNVFKLIFQVAE